MDSLGQKIKELRKEKNLTQPELARLLNVSNGVISFWENNINEPKATYVKQLAIIFNVSSDYILGLEK
ncbi:MAG: helix-turn-helix transcriptional regulator [Clostridia bacterium]|nr:helix-turn-helix transcriptional regulator [Clostridia bacterium]